MVAYPPENLIYDRRHRREVTTRAIRMIAADRSVGFRRILHAGCQFDLVLMDMVAKVGVGRACFMLAIDRGSPPGKLDWHQHQHDEDKGFAHARDGSSRNAPRQ